MNSVAAMIKPIHDAVQKPQSDMNIDIMLSEDAKQAELYLK